jgi:exopolysaccharide biosynthesis protein
MSRAPGDWAEKQGAVAAINGSFFIGTRALGPIAANGEWLQKDTFPQQVLIVNNDKITAKILPTHEALTENPAQMMLALPGSHVLVQNGIAKVDFGPDNAGSMLNGRHRRTAAGWTENGEAFLVTAGGMTIPEFASVMYKIGVHTAINLDGGSSSGMVTEVDGQVSKGPSQPIAIFLGVYARN